MKARCMDQCIPTRLIFGCGSVEKLATMTLPGKKALLVISCGTSMHKFGYLDKVKVALKANNVEVIIYDKVQVNPTKNNVMEAAALCRKEKCDFIVALGGGSTIDSSKATAIMARNEGDYWDYIASGTGKKKPMTEIPLPLIAIPTTGGTGSEVDQRIVITNEDTHEKTGFGNIQTFPVCAIVDPQLMLSVPPIFTAFQGMDAFFHAVEGYLANIATPLSELYSLESIHLLSNNLHKAVVDGSDIETRTKVAWASTLSGMVIATSSCISQHSLEHAMSAYYPALPHGAGLIALSLAYFSHFVYDVPERYIKMAEVMTGKKVTDPNEFIHALAAMQTRCHVDTIKLSDYGIKSADLPRFVSNATETMGKLFEYDPQKLTDGEKLDIYRKSFR